MTGQRADLTFKHNLQQGRHGWLRLTPAYSVKVVQQILASVRPPARVLDPFSGTGTTGLVCAEQGICCDLVELNPFLVWLAEAKTRNYTSAEISAAADMAENAAALASKDDQSDARWAPPINHIERWWPPQRLATLASLLYYLQDQAKDGMQAACDLWRLAFCRVTIQWSHASFNHPSMSFRSPQPTLFESQERAAIIADFRASAHRILSSAAGHLAGGMQVHLGDSRRVDAVVSGPYDCVITSPPYPNRVSYIRELRPYMYWLGYLDKAREAAELDWEAIGGTWGVATSRLARWKPTEVQVCDAGFTRMIEDIGSTSPLLANYVHKYFLDIAVHLGNLRKRLAPGASVFYIIGNSKFYDTIVPTDKLYVSLLRQWGFEDIACEVLRKRNCKKELYEFVVSGRWAPNDQSSEKLGRDRVQDDISRSAAHPADDTNTREEAGVL
ncbi:MAG: SAM-dependent methyltransferase [Armatimonadota bacterium]|nr:SAM-dependent methyltransferase [Armatimonadota bacterium]